MTPEPVANPSLKAREAEADLNRTAGVSPACGQDGCGPFGIPHFHSLSAPEGGEGVKAGRHWVFVLPVLIFALLALGFYIGLGIDATVLPSALIDEPAPEFDLPPLPGHEPGFSTADLRGHVSLVNTFASWCAPCRAEHAVLNALAASKRVPIYGIDYKDKEETALAWIATLGNPYTRIGADSGRVGIDWGIYGVPETFVVDRAGRIRYKHVGPLTQRDVERKILPLVAKLEQQ
jgi:cytochrome c biogenesis protein CcmG, thiol:disulfide interchange protein DsbE